MNKNNISWIHYAYATITASVLAYVTVMDSTGKSQESDNAINMLPTFDDGSDEPIQEESGLYEDNIQDSALIEPNAPPMENSEPYDDEPPMANAEPVVDEPPMANAEPVVDEPAKGGKLKKTKHKHIKLKNNKTRGRK